MRKFSSNPEVKALADLVWDYFSREEQYQLDRRIVNQTPFDPWVEEDKNALMLAEQTEDVGSLNALLQKYRELDVKGRQRMACKTCPCGKPHCNCKKRRPEFDQEFDDRNHSFLGGNADQIQIAWVRANCKFAKTPTHSLIPK